MAVNNVHPLYAENLDDWQKVRDTYQGERVVKARDTLYLPPTSGMQADGMNSGQPGRQAFNAYKTRAVFHDYMSDGVEAMLGLLWAKPPTFEVPAPMEPLLERATLRGEPMDLLLRRINEEQLVTGRIGVLLDFPENPPPDKPLLPYFVTYKAEEMLNWDEGTPVQMQLPKLNLVVLNESQNQRQADFTWRYAQIYRVLTLGATDTDESVGIYKQGLFTNISEPNSTVQVGGLEFNDAVMKTPSIRGNTLDEIPFVFINSKDLVPTPDNPPLLGLANLSLAVYRGEADYRQNLFMQGQDTLVIIGATDEGDQQRVGAGAAIRLPISGDAKYIGVNSQGLSEQRQALENDKKQAEHRAGQLIDTSSSAKESGEALRIRVAAQTVTLNQIALAGAAGLEALLKIAARWMGLDDTKVKVTPNLEFTTTPLGAADLQQLATAKTMGLPLSRESIHDVLKDKGWTQKTFDEEMAAIEAEQPIGGLGTTVGGDAIGGPGGNLPNNGGASGA